jgi:hypothetical protein
MAQFCRRRSAWCRLVLTAALASGCNSTSAPTGPSAAPPAAVATPPGYTATPVPFGLGQSRTFDIVGWDSSSSASTQFPVQFRWNAGIGKYEVVAPGATEWSRLEARPPDFRLWDTPVYYDVFGSSGTKLPFSMFVWIPPRMGPMDAYVGDARILENPQLGAWIKFGLRTEPGDVPVSGTMTCNFGEDEIGGGELTFDLAAGTVSGWAEPFWARVRYQLVQTSFARGATTFAVRFGTDGVMEGRFFGPRAVNVAVRSRGGGDGSAAVTGPMAGWCEG